MSDSLELINMIDRPATPVADPDATQHTSPNTPPSLELPADAAVKKTRDAILRQQQQHSIAQTHRTILYSHCLLLCCPAAILVDATKSMAEAFDAWMLTQPRNVILPDAVHAEIIDVISTKQAAHASYKMWLKRGYFCRATQGITTLHITISGAKPKARGASASGKSVKDAIKVEDDSSNEDEQACAPPSSAAAVTAAPQQSAPGEVTRRVPRQSEILELIRELHERRLHPGARTTYYALQVELHSIPRIVVEAFVARCGVCVQKASKKKNGKAAIMGIFSTRVNERCQMDLFDMQTTPGGPNKVRLYTHTLLQQDLAGYN
jgi:hypothetical protein